jgi:ribonuclease P protein subunit POP4
MSADEFNIEEFLNAKFKNLDKKGTNVNKNKQEKAKPSGENKMLVDMDYIFDNTIDKQTIEGVITKSQSNINVNNILMPLFPNEKVFLDEFKDKKFILDKFINNESKVKDRTIKLSDNKQFIDQLKSDTSLNYTELYSSMYTLWSSYIKSLLNNATQPDTIYNKILKADLHGSIIQVIESKNSNQVGIEGIVLLETKRAFVIITKANKVKVILKKGSRFRLDLQYTAVKIIGDNFMYKAVERTKTKYKNKYII